MTTSKLYNQIKEKESFLCVGLDTDIEKIPSHLLKFEDPVFEFNKQIIDATADLAISYKPNTAFYETRGAEGWKSLEKTATYIKKNYPDLFLIADAKRGDIGNTSKMYAKAFFEKMKFDAVTVAPYMGEDSVKPFIGYKDKYVIVLGLTSNAGSSDFQMLRDADSNNFLFEKVLQTVSQWGNPENLMFVAGATKAEMMTDIRKIIPNNFLLVPGIGAQGGSLEATAKNGMNNKSGLIVNSSRGIIFADNSKKFAEVARQKASELQQQMSLLIK